MAREGGGMDMGKINMPHAGPISTLAAVGLMIGFLRMPFKHPRMFKNCCIVTIPLTVLWLVTGDAPMTSSLMTWAVIVVAFLVAVNESEHAAKKGKTPAQLTHEERVRVAHAKWAAEQKSNNNKRKAGK